MRSALPKVLHPLCGRPMVVHVLAALREAGIRRGVVVTGHEAMRVRAAIDAYRDHPALAGLALTYVTQPLARGTGHAVLEAREAIGRTGAVLVVNGDAPLVTAAQIRAVLAAGVPPADSTATVSPAVIGVGTVADPSRLGRVLRDADGRVRGVIEEADADAATRAVQEVNLGLYRFAAAWLWDTLASLPPSASGEIYLTDAIARAAAAGGVIGAPVAAEGRLNVEDRRDLARAEAILRTRIRERWLDAGVTLRDPDQTYIDADVEIGADTVIEPGTHLRGRTRVGAGCVLGPHAVVRESVIGEGCALRSCTVEEAMLGQRVDVGPYSHLRAGTLLADDVHIGTHAETKNARLGRGVMMGHFAYIGDAEIGAGTNIGAGVITCNFDGQAKHRTVVGERVFLGSDTLLIAPLEIGDDAATGAGAVVNHSVPPDTLVVGHPARAARRRDRRTEGHA